MKPLFIVFWIFFVIVLCSIFYFSGEREGRDIIIEEIETGDCLEWKDFECPGGELYKFCDRYEYLIT